MDQTPVTVVAVLSGPSVANVQASAGRRLTAAERSSVRAQRAAEQSGKRGSIEATGGRIVRSYQSAINGFKVTIPRNKVEELRRVPGVVEVLRVGTFVHENAVSVPRINAPAAWAGVNGVHGENVKIAIIDTGIDYTHADFGGPGTPAAYTTAHAASTAPADPSLFGPDAPKVKGGIDLVGDAYNANVAGSMPVPDPNPLDCNGHGSHVAGSAAGFGVLANGTTYTGSYDQLTHINNSFSIGPGVAPKADLYAVRVFGCAGSTNVVVDAIEWAMENDMDVISMSLGSNFGPGDTADAVAVDNATKAGVVVVSAAGNAGDINYVLGSPGSGIKGIAVAAGNKELNDRTANIALGAVAADPVARSITAINANNADWISPSNLDVVVLKTPTGGISLGCNPAEYVAAGVAGKIAVVQRGTCARVARAIFGQQAGAAAVVMINNAASLPPFEGQITENPDDHVPFTVTIPFFGVRGPASGTSDGIRLAQRDGTTVALTEGTPIIPPIASFTSTGPRAPDGKLKPDITAPGVAIVSVNVGTGNGSVAESGTSMATPHISGVAALVLQAHPKWKPAAVKSAIINSGDPSAFPDYAARRAGTGMVNAGAAVGSLAYAFGDKDETAANFGLEEFAADLSQTQTITVKNDDSTAATFNVTVDRKAGSPHTLTLSANTITVPAKGSATVDITLAVPVATAGNSDAFHDVAGLITFTPMTPSINRGFSLKVPYYLVPRVSSNINAALALPKNSSTGVLAVTNQASPITATADVYAWGLEDVNEGFKRFDLRAVGVQTFPGSTDAVLAFAVNTFKSWSSPEENEFDIYIDNNNDGNPDFIIFNADFGSIVNNAANGQVAAFVFNTATRALSVDFLCSVSTDSSTIVLPVKASRLGVTPGNPRFGYAITAFDLFSNDQDTIDDTAFFNAFSPAVSTGQFAVVPPNTTQSLPVSINVPETFLTAPKGYMIISPDNKNGAGEAKLIRMKLQ